MTPSSLHYARDTINKSEHISNTLFFLDEEYLELYQDIIRWNEYYDVDVNSLLRDQWKKMNEIMGFDNQLRIRSDGLCAAWAFSHESCDAVIWVSNRGTALEIVYGDYRPDLYKPSEDVTESTWKMEIAKQMIELVHDKFFGE